MTNSVTIWESVFSRGGPYFMKYGVGHGLTLLVSLRPGTALTVQALSEGDHKFWMLAMGGKEPVSQTTLHYVIIRNSLCY